MVIETESGKITRFCLIILIHPKGLYTVQETFYTGFKVKCKPYSLVQLRLSYFSKSDFLLGVIKTFLIMDIVTAATSTITALSLIALFLVIKTTGFAPKWSPERFPQAS